MPLCTRACVSDACSPRARRKGTHVAPRPDCAGAGRASSTSCVREGPAGEVLRAAPGPWWDRENGLSALPPLARPRQLCGDRSLGSSKPSAVIVVFSVTTSSIPQGLWDHPDSSWSPGQLAVSSRSPGRPVPSPTAPGGVEGCAPHLQPGAPAGGRPPGSHLVFFSRPGWCPQEAGVEESLSWSDSGSGSGGSGPASKAPGAGRVPPRVPVPRPWSVPSERGAAGQEQEGQGTSHGAVTVPDVGGRPAPSEPDPGARGQRPAPGSRDTCPWRCPCPFHSCTALRTRGPDAAAPAGWTPRRAVASEGCDPLCVLHTCARVCGSAPVRADSRAPEARSDLGRGLPGPGSLRAQTARVLQCPPERTPRPHPSRPREGVASPGEKPSLGRKEALSRSPGPLPSLGAAQVFCWGE